MKVTLTNGEVVPNLPMSAANCSGFRATEITLTARDFRALRAMPIKTLYASLAQLEARFGPPEPEGVEDGDPDEGSSRVSV